MLFRDVLFGKANASGPMPEAFGRRWPAILDGVRDLKRKAGHKVVARTLQRLESTIMMEEVVPRLLAGDGAVGVLTIHDSLAVMATDADRARLAIEAAFAGRGLKPKVRVE